MSARTHIGIVAFPAVMQMDLTGPYGVFAAAPGAVVDLLWKNTAPVTTSDRLILTPTKSFAECPQLDMVCVPGGAGVLELLEDAETHAFLRQQAKKARYVCSVCTGALILGAAGLLSGYKATTHWQSWEMLAEFGATPTRERVVMDRNRITAAGVSAGIDMALALVGELFGADVAREIELNMEYDPQPPFRSGTPFIAPPEVVERSLEKAAARQRNRLEVVRRAADKLQRMESRY